MGNRRSNMIPIPTMTQISFSRYLSFRKNAPQSRISARRFVIQKSFHSCTDTLMYKNQRQNKYDYNSGNTHNCRHTGLTFIRILRIHI